MSTFILLKTIERSTLRVILTDLEFIDCHALFTTEPWKVFTNQEWMNCIFMKRWLFLIEGSLQKWRIYCYRNNWGNFQNETLFKQEICFMCLWFLKLIVEMTASWLMCLWLCKFTVEMMASWLMCLWLCKFTVELIASLLMCYGCVNLP